MMLRLINVILLLLIVVSALSVVYVKHENRMLYTQLRDLQKQRDLMDVDWGRLQLEQSTWATHSRVDNIARKRLAMRTLDYSEIVVVKP